MIVKREHKEPVDGEIPGGSSGGVQSDLRLLGTPTASRGF